MLMLNIIVAHFVGYELPEQLWKYFFFLQNFSEGHLVFFPESWSLSVEEFAYVLAPIMLYCCCVVLKNRKQAYLLATVFLIVIFGITKVNYFYDNENTLTDLTVWNSNLKAIVIFRLDAIYYGFLMAYIFKFAPIFFKEKRYVLFILGTILFCVTNWLFLQVFNIRDFPFFANVLYLPLNSIAIALFLPYLYYIQVKSLWGRIVITRISLYSYAIYLLHYTFVLYLMRVFIPFDNFSIFQKMGYVFLYLIITYLLSSIIYRYFERPITDLRDHSVFKK